MPRYRRLNIKGGIFFFTVRLMPACRRHRRCSGDPTRCRQIFWPVVPEELKAWWQAILDVRRDGRSLGQARRLADEALVRQKRIMALRARAGDES